MLLGACDPDLCFRFNYVSAPVSVPSHNVDARRMTPSDLDHETYSGQKGGACRGATDGDAGNGGDIEGLGVVWAGSALTIFRRAA